MNCPTSATRYCLLLGLTASILITPPIDAQRGGPALPAGPASANPALDLEGYWVSVVTEDWKFRMVTPERGAYGGVPLSPEGRRVADTWDPAADRAAGLECKAYSAPAIMRIPGRLHITWRDDDTLQIDTDAGMQTRLFQFGPPVVPTEPTWQGTSIAEWERANGPGSLKVMTTGMTPGYVRRNGVPYSEDAVLTEHFDLHSAPNGDEWLVVTTILEDPVYYNGPFVTSTNFKRVPDDSSWNPTPCTTP